MEKNLLYHLHKGKIVFSLYGQKLKGNYALGESPNRSENARVLMDLKDKYAKATDLIPKKINLCYRIKLSRK